ncbi:hypothetical protein BDM02DRAFT_1379534 [Thelephora ganbajun]|uniref:Uncharacterized protein n=1 Tax=Thelephora ganbajun TaxID=370292 RepID=A0ACB6ZLT3_THEGA|nr:hypothetical protein BDM02DRAFT_1379534 [Thelephora ganbajun]
MVDSSICPDMSTILLSVFISPECLTSVWAGEPLPWIGVTMLGGYTHTQPDSCRADLLAIIFQSHHPHPLSIPFSCLPNLFQTRLGPVAESKTSRGTRPPASWSGVASISITLASTFPSPWSCYLLYQNQYLKSWRKDEPVNRLQSIWISFDTSRPSLPIPSRILYTLQLLLYFSNWGEGGGQKASTFSY